MVKKNQSRRCSGSTILMEITRVLGDLRKDGWKLRKTFKLWSRGAEEFGLIG